MKLFGKSIGFVTMKEILYKIWKFSAHFDHLDIVHRFFMVKFDLGNDREKVINEGAWMIFYHYLMVKCWSPEFIAPMEKINCTMV